MRQIQSHTPFSSSSLLSFLTNKTDRPWLSFSSAALVKTATPLMWPKEGAWELFHFAVTDSPLCNNLHYYHRWSIIMISLLWSLQKIVTCSSKWAACSPTRRRREVACNHLDMSRGLEAIFRPYYGLLKQTLPKAQRTWGLSSYYKFLHKSWSNFIFRIEKNKKYN